MKYFLGIIFIVIGFIVVWKSDWLYENMGAVAFAEEKMGSWGGSKFFYKLIGILIIFLSFLFMSGGLGAIMRKMFGGTSV